MDIVKALLGRLDFLLAAVLFVVGWYFGTRAERRHLASLAHDEHALAHIKVSSERFYKPTTLGSALLVTGSVVIAQDRFKLVVASILSLFGKNLTVYESLIERARREAVVRAKYQAQAGGYDALYGLRFEMTEVAEGGVEVLAYATAVKMY